MRVGRPVDPTTGRKRPYVSMSVNDALRLLIVVLLLAPVCLILAATVSPYAILVVLIAFVLWHAVRM